MQQNWKLSGLALSTSLPSLAKPISLCLSDNVLHLSAVVRNLDVYTTLMNTYQWTQMLITVPRLSSTCDGFVGCAATLTVTYCIRWYVHWLSRLNYCSSLFICSLQCTLCHLQCVQDAAARLLCGTPPQTQAPSLKQLHWLPMLSWIQFKLCTLMYDIWHRTAPQWRLA